MSTPEPVDLETFGLAEARALVGEVFVRRNPDGPDVPLTLVAAAKARRDPAADPDADRPFSVRFSGPADPCLTQGMHDLDHPRCPVAGIFLTRVAAGGEGAHYEAVFG